MCSELIHDITGHEISPAALLEAQFLQVARQNMADLPFYRRHIPVRACGFRVYEDQWFGAMLTPWMMELMVLPGPGQQWPRRPVGERIGLEFPTGNLAFRVGEMAGLHYLACSLMSPLDAHLSAEQALALAENSVTLALSLPVREEPPAVNASRRALLRGKVA
ncbi:hydrogenase-2 assembly chaperone [Entomohabitans teleogrylli]|uniref:hydrogenase-2 assembly chaperone n=1 Tax=Entomohabitans teleogrylli TaxID=1384589 RepID=UPI00073D2E26|nr:hydrogenase-2 assembly chaperone [Entomohabitans teleogrylli]